MELNEILKVAIKGGASDIHLKSGLPPMFRVDGALVPLKNGERIMPDEDGRTEFHYVIVDYLCEYESGEARANSDVAVAEWVRVDALNSKKMAPGTPPVISEALALRERLTK